MANNVQFQILPVTPFEQNCTLLWCARTRAAVVIDPGGDTERILALISELRLRPERILLTHGHLDHVGASAEVAQHLALPIVGPHRDDAFLIRGLEAQSHMFGLPRVRNFEPEQWLQDGDRVKFGEESLQVLHCPGHTPGHLVFFDPSGRLAQVGDLIFRGSVGRTDFPRGDHQQLLDSIRRRLFPLGDDVSFIPGHGPMSTLGQERLRNPFVRG